MSLKYDILKYMLQDPVNDRLTPMLTKSHRKSAHGFSHIDTAALLCPVKQMRWFDKDSIYVHCHSFTFFDDWFIS